MQEKFNRSEHLKTQQKVFDRYLLSKQSDLEINFLIVAGEERPMKKIKPNSAETAYGKFTVVVYFYYILFTYLKTITDFL